MSDYQHVRHPFGPLYDKKSRILILGSFPSVKSREQKFFYGHPQNRFWKVMAAILEEPIPGNIPKKKEMLQKHHIALFDVIESCDIAGSSDASIKNAVPTDLGQILETAPIQRIYTNGGTATKLFQKYQAKTLQRDCKGLPSTSPANAAWSLERLIDAWHDAFEEDGIRF